MVSDLHQAWSERQVRTVSPNEQVFVTLTGNSSVRVEFAPGYVERVSSAQLCEQLERTARKVFVDRTRAWLDTVADTKGSPTKLRDRPVDPLEAELFRRRDELEVEGTSSDGSVRVVVIGMTHFTVALAAGVMTGLSAEALAAACGEAATTVLLEQIAAMKRIQAEIYYPELLEQA